MGGGWGPHYSINSNTVLYNQLGYVRSMRPSALFALPLVLMLVVASVPVSGEWPSFRHDPANSGATTGPLPMNNTPLWMNESGERVTSTAAVADGMVFFVTDAENLYARNATTGVAIWKKSLGSGKPGTSDLMSSPTFYKGILYIGSVAGLLHAIDAKTGNTSWTFNATGEIKSSPMIVGEKVIFGTIGAGGANCGLTALDLTGKLVWRSPIGSYIWVSPASDGGRVFVGSCDRTIRAFNVSDGREAWNYDTGNFITASAAVFGDLVVVGNHGGQVTALDSRTGSFRWEFDVPGASKVETSPAVQGDAVLVGDGSGVLYNISLGTGEEVWNVSVGKNIISSPVIAGDRFVVCDSDGEVEVRFLSNGALNWSYPTNQPVISSPAVSDGRIYIGSTNGVFYCFGAVTQVDGDGDGDGGGDGNGNNMVHWALAMIAVVALLGTLTMISTRLVRKK